MKNRRCVAREATRGVKPSIYRVAAGKAKSPVLADEALQRVDEAGLAVAVHGVTNVVLRLAPLVLEVALGLLGLALRLGRRVVGCVAPLFLDLATGLLEGAFDAITVHGRVPPMWSPASCRRCTS